MTTIKITNEVRQKLNEFKEDGESVEDTVNRLLDLTESDLNQDMSFGGGSTNINLSNNTMKRIKTFQVRNNESYGRILHRALIIADNKNI